MWLVLCLVYLLLVQLANCKLNLNAYNFGRNGGSITFNYDENNYPNTKLDSIELSFMTYTFNCTLLHISSAISTDHITIRLENGVPIASYNLGYRTHQITFRKAVQVNDGNHHRLRFNRFGQNSTLQLDSNQTVNLHPKSKLSTRPFTVFNAHSHIRLGGIDSRPQQFFNYETEAIRQEQQNDDADDLKENDSNGEEDTNNLGDNDAISNSQEIKRKNKLSHLSNQIVNSLINQKSNHLSYHFVGIMMNAFVNEYSLLDMAAEDNPKVIVSGDVRLLITLPKMHKSNHFDHHIKSLPHNRQPQDLIELMQGDQPAHERINVNKNKVVRVKNDKTSESSKDKQQQNYDGDDLIFSGSGCFDDEDECANYADAGSGYDDLIITPVYVPLKPTPISQLKSKSNSNKSNKKQQAANKQRSKCAAPTIEEQANRVRTEDDDNEEDDEEDDEDCGSGYEPASSNSEETTERSSNAIDSQINNNEVFPYQLSTEQSNVINPVTVDDDDKSILFTSQPIPPPASELEKIIESTTRRPPPPPKRPGSHIEIVMLPLPSSESATPKTNFMNKGLIRDNKKYHPSGIQITGGLSPNDINMEDELDASFDGNYNQAEMGREPSPGETSDLLGGAISINKNLIDFKFNKNSADRTALLIAAIAILIIVIVIIAPIVVFIKMRLRISRNSKLSAGVITTQLSSAYQATNKSYASLAASGTMHPLGGPMNQTCNAQAFTSNPNFHSSMHHLALGNVMPNLTLTTNPVYGTIDSKAPRLPNKKDLGKEWYV